MMRVSAAAPSIEVDAPAAILIEQSTGEILYEKNAHEALPPASVTKVMTLLLVMEALEDGRISWEDTVTASETAAAKGGSQIYLEPGEQMSMDEMLKSVVVSSANVIVFCFCGNHHDGHHDGDRHHDHSLAFV